MEALMPGIARWLHFLVGITWIGLLYYFNLVQMAALKDAGADGTAAGITKHVAPRALLPESPPARPPAATACSCSRISKANAPRTCRTAPAFLWA